MKIEHAAWQVQDPAAAAAWYVEHLGMHVVREGGPPAHASFLADASSSVLVEIYNNPKVDVPDYRAMDPLHLHLAFVSADVPGDRARLLAAGATAVGEVETTPAGDVLAMLRDPWGFAIQLADRSEPML